jgi:hypothetical protein
MCEHDVRTAIRLRSLQAFNHAPFDIGHRVTVGLPMRIAPSKVQVYFVLRLQAEARSVVCPISGFGFHDAPLRVR